MKGETLLLKGYTTVLSEAEVVKNPGLRGIYNALLEQDKQYEAWHTKKHDGMAPSQDFTDGLPNAFPIAIPQSAVKAGSKLQASALNFEELNNPEKLQEYNDAVKKIMYNGRGSFMGMQGYNFGPQQVMDKKTFEVRLPVQQVNSVMVGAEII